MKNIQRKLNLKMLTLLVSCFLVLTVALIAIACANATPKETPQSPATNRTEQNEESTIPVAKEQTIYDYMRFEKNQNGYTLTEVVGYPERVLLLPAQMPDGSEITAIGDGAFSGCTELVEVTIPATVKSIGIRCFAGARSLVAVNVEPSSSVFCSVGGVLFSRDRSELICYPAAKVGSTYLLSTSVKRIAPYAFDGVSNLKAIRYEGSATKYQSIEIGEGNKAFTSLPVTCNYKGAK